MSAVSVRLPDDLAARLEELAHLTGRSESDYILEAVREHLDDLEDLYVAEKRLTELREGRSTAFTLDQVVQDLGLAD